MCLICARFKTVQRDHFGRSLLIVIGAKLDVKNKKCALIVKINTQHLSKTPNVKSDDGDNVFRSDPHHQHKSAIASEGREQNVKVSI